ncbi:HD domain-containing protein [archaeon]|nr:HD domain-containing protein [archaeon]
MHVIKDPIHKDITISNFEMSIIDTNEMQRLRNIKQLGPTSLVYPSAVHTRFEHSIGVMHIAEKIAQAIKLNNQTTKELKIAALMHDIGHLPYSHINRIENMNLKATKKDHMDIGIDKIKTNYSSLLEKHNINTNNVCNLIKGKDPIGAILSSGIDIDKMDYLVRDAYFTGTAYGTIDLSRLISTATYNKKTFGFLSKGIKNVESVVISRYLMFSAVYQHDVIEIAMEMLGRSVQNLCDNKILNLNDLKNMDDADLITLIRRNKEKLGILIDQRKILKSINNIHENELDNKTKENCIKLSKNPTLLKETEKLIAKELKLKNDEFLIRIRSFPKSIENTQIYENNNFVELKSISPLTKTLEKESKQEWKIMLISKENKKSLGLKAKKLFLKNI